MVKLEIYYGSGRIDLDIGDVEVLDQDHGGEESVRSIYTAAARKGDVIKNAIENPCGTERLREKIAGMKKDGKIVIVVDDHTRDVPTEKMLDALTEEIAIFRDHSAEITLLVACGTHEPPGEEDLRRILGKYSNHNRYIVKISDCDAKDMVYVGTTSRGTPVKLNRDYVDANIRILTGDITLHYYAGFGGGRKSILPGISSRETITKNHLLLTDMHARTANIERNPVHLDMSEAASFAPPDFVLNIVAAGNGNVVAAYAGEVNQVFSKGVEVAKDLFCRETYGLFDLLIVSAGGYPKDSNLYQATKAVENCYRAVVQGGELILVAECREGIGDRYFEEWMNRYRSFEETEEAIRTNFVLGGHKAYYIRKVMNRIGLSVVSSLDAAVLRSWEIKAYRSVQEALAAVKKEGVSLRIGVVKKGVDILIQDTNFIYNKISNKHNGKSCKAEEDSSTRTESRRRTGMDRP